MALFARVLRYFELNPSAVIEVKTEGGYIVIFIVYHASSEDPELPPRAYTFSDYENAEHCFFQLDVRSEPLHHQDFIDGKAMLEFLEQFKRDVSVDLVPSEWVAICDSPLIENLFALSVVKLKPLAQY